MVKTEIVINLPAYDEPLDSENIDPDPHFRETLRILNLLGVHTVSSCQGHAPGTQYDDVQEWMDPYITCEGSVHLTADQVVRYLIMAGGNATQRTTGFRNPILAKFPRGWNWTTSVKNLIANNPHIRL